MLQCNLSRLTRGHASCLRVHSSCANRQKVNESEHVFGRGQERKTVAAAFIGEESRQIENANKLEAVSWDRRWPSMSLVDLPLP